jgi:hypothetical protein
LRLPCRERYGSLWKPWYSHGRPCAKGLDLGWCHALAHRGYEKNSYEPFACQSSLINYLRAFITFKALPVLGSLRAEAGDGQGGCRVLEAAGCLEMHHELFISPNAAAVAAIKAAASSPCATGAVGCKRPRPRVETLSCCSLGTGMKLKDFEERPQWPGARLGGLGVGRGAATAAPGGGRNRRRQRARG